MIGWAGCLEFAAADKGEFVVRTGAAAMCGRLSRGEANYIGFNTAFGIAQQRTPSPGPAYRQDEGVKQSKRSIFFSFILLSPYEASCVLRRGLETPDSS